MPIKRINNGQTTRNYRDKTFIIDSITKQQIYINHVSAALFLPKSLPHRSLEQLVYDRYTTR
ncbi:hypothetical protein JWG39_12975 [Desulforhopalus vacuolatus]|uniref:hypothetical protein n=1 Tax=Desulforhopalus vacuolatus TaxID=40414 RepID=UPI001962CDA1|nr:hypothetical protein [Desulforhopalus vacuolatus]MBM9520728.1 hypothetical protein [Desulforhopalus vacuolatus]